MQKSKLFKNFFEKARKEQVIFDSLLTKDVIKKISELTIEETNKLRKRSFLSIENAKAIGYRHEP